LQSTGDFLPTISTNACQKVLALKIQTDLVNFILLGMCQDLFSLRHPGNDIRLAFALAPAFGWRLP
jgi:hypothetical protein